jgi:4-alpha-glucanotransferase
MQDFLSLGEWARMNYPGKPSGNWDWRMHPNAIDEGLINRLYETNFLYGRLPPQEKKQIREKIKEETKGEVMPH